MFEDDSSKTEEPTEKRLGKAKEEGNVLTSQEIKSWAALLGLCTFLILITPWAASRLSLSLTPYLANLHTFDTSVHDLQTVLIQLLLQVGLVMLPIFLIFMTVAIAANVAMSGLTYSTSKMKMKVSKINPLKGWKKVLSVQKLVTTPRDLVKISVVMLFAFIIVLPSLGALPTLPGLEIEKVILRIRDLAIMLTLSTLAVMTPVAIMDLFYQRFQRLKKLRMTKQEVKDEHKNTEGNPEVKARLRRIRMDRYSQRMMSNVPTADVVITNPTHYAVALSYKIDDMRAPVLVAKGADFMAAKIREVAEENDVPIVENPPLTRALYATVELDQEIPYEHYKPVAEIIGYVMRLKGTRRK